MPYHMVQIHIKSPYKIKISVEGWISGKGEPFWESKTLHLYFAINSAMQRHINDNQNSVRHWISH